MSFSGLPPVRDDFRCSLCRQKGVFHCEHDTPYRDQYLGAYEHEKPHITQRNSRKESPRAGLRNNNYATNHNGAQNTNTGRGINSIAGSHYDEDKRPDKYPVSNTNNSSKTNEQKKKNKSCVIL